MKRDLTQRIEKLVASRKSHIDEQAEADMRLCMTIIFSDIEAFELAAAYSDFMERVIVDHPELRPLQYSGQPLVDRLDAATRARADQLLTSLTRRMQWLEEHPPKPLLESPYY